MQRIYKNTRCHELSGFGSAPRMRSALAVLVLFFSTAGCATVSVYEPSASADVSLTEAQSELHKSAEAYCEETRDKGLATGETSLGSLAGILTGKSSDRNAYWRKIGADRGAPAAVVRRVRSDMNAAAKGLAGLSDLAHTMMGATSPTRSDVAQCERALIHARQARDSFADALAEVNKRTDADYQISLELTPLDEALATARRTADELAAARNEVVAS
jgi:hypothetical protein